MYSRQFSNENSESEEKPKVDLAENNINNLKNISPFMSKHLAAAAGFNVDTPIVSAIIGNLTGTLPLKKSETETFKCEVCDCELTSDANLNFHLNGSKHKKRLKGLEILSQLKDVKSKGVYLGIEEYHKALECEICSVRVNSAQQLEIHLSGAKHKKMAFKASIVPVPDTVNLNEDSEPNESTDNNLSPPAPKKKKKEEPVLIPCDVCNLFLNSKIQYDQHVLSKKHRIKSENVQQMNQSQKKLPQMRSQFPVNQMHYKGTHHFAPIYSRLFSHPNFMAKNPLSKDCKNG